MNTREFFLERRRAERPAFVKVLRALPEDRLDYRPDDRSPSAHQLASTIVFGVHACVKVATTGRSEWRHEPPAPLAQLADSFDQFSRELDERVAAMDDAAWQKTAQFYVNGQLVAEQPVGTFLWFILFDGIHHRGQLTAYLRPMGGKVPSVYGPSADEPPPRV